jgi:hypothetical protein
MHLFLKPQVVYLRHIIRESGVRSDPRKVEAIEKLEPPKTVKQVKSFLRITGFYRKYIPFYADIAKPLTLLTRKDKEFFF